MNVRLHQPSRSQAALVTLLLAGLGLVLWRIAAAHLSDNAYVWPWMAGIAMMAISVPFLVAMLLPDGAPRRIVVTFGNVSLLLIVAGSVLLIVPYIVMAPLAEGLAVITGRVFLVHLLGLVALAAVALLAGLRLRR